MQGYSEALTSALNALEANDPERKDVTSVAAVLIIDMLMELVEKELAKAVHDGLLAIDQSAMHSAGGFGVPLDAVEMMQVVVKASDVLKMNLHQVADPVDKDGIQHN